MVNFMSHVFHYNKKRYHLNHSQEAGTNPLTDIVFDKMFVSYLRKIRRKAQVPIQLLLEDVVSWSATKVQSGESFPPALIKPDKGLRNRGQCVLGKASTCLLHPE